MKIIAGVLMATALAFSSGCAKTDWIDRTLVTVDVTGTWYGTLGATGFFSMELKQQGPTVKGFIQSSGSGVGSLSGPIDGTVTGDLFRFLYARGDLEGQLTLTLDEMAGRISRVGGGGPAGVFSVVLRRIDPSSVPASPPR